MLAATALAAGATGPVRVRETAATLTIDNQLLSLTIDKKTGDVSSMTYTPGDTPIRLGDSGPRAAYWDVNATPTDIPPGRESARPRGDYTRPFQCLNGVRPIVDTPEMADVLVDAGPSEWFPFHGEFHYVVRRGVSGFYAYARFSHDKGMPAAVLEQSRITIRAENKGALFTEQFVDDSRKGLPYTHTIESTLQDATFRLANGAAYTKYDNSQFIKNLSAVGMAGHETGLWFVWPSAEFVNGGPFRQELTVQMDNIMQAMFQGEHFGAAPIRVAENERWSKVVGPVLLYVNHGGTPGALWEDAKQQVAREKAAWPYGWLQCDGYRVHRGEVRGRLQLRNNGGDPKAQIKDAWIVLASNEAGEEHTDFAMRAKGYQFWTRADADGRFEIDKVRPGTYTLFAVGADQFDTFEYSPVTVSENLSTVLNDLTWNIPDRGRILWQIGIPDRSTADFHDGAEPAYRNYDAFLSYFKAFPHDVDFMIGRSTEAQDWEYAQWDWYNETPHWTVRFAVTPADLPSRGKAVLTLGITSAQINGNLLVAANGHEIAKLTIHKTGTAGYRSGAQDNLYTVERIPFDAALLHAGQNDITLAHARSEKFTPALLAKEKRPHHDIMYDALRLEISGP